MKRILIVGPCYADAKSLRKRFEEIGEVTVDEVSGVGEAIKFLDKKKYDVIFVTRICKSDDSEGIELVKFVRKKSLKTRIFLLTRHQDVQKRAIAEGADDAFDMDLLIGYIRPSMKERHEEIIEKMKELFSA